VRALVVVALVVAVAASGAAAAQARTLVLYSVAKQEQFVNNADDRTRGVGKNPFGNYKDVAPVTSKNATGPFPGDEAIFSFNLYANAALKQRAGAAIFTCHYNFARNAFCDAVFQLAGKGTLLAGGGFNFDATSFTLAVAGGTGSLAGTVGVLRESPAAGHAQRLVFQLR
jgi:hypothetical protein